jgi:hypothetical protein
MAAGPSTRRRASTAPYDPSVSPAFDRHTAMTATANPVPHAAQASSRLYDDEGDRLVQADVRADRIILLPAGDPRKLDAPGDTGRIRLQWGQHLLADLLARRYRTLVCGVNATDNGRGIIAQLAELMPTSQWNARSITAHAEQFSRSIASDDVLVLKFDLDVLEVLALLRPMGRDHFTLDDLGRGFRKVAQMLEGRRDRLPCASVSFLGAKSNRLVGRPSSRDAQREPSLEAALRTMHEAGFRGDVYPPTSLWQVAPTCVFASYPFPGALDTMRQGGH